MLPAEECCDRPLRGRDGLGGAKLRSCKLRQCTQGPKLDAVRSSKLVAKGSLPESRRGDCRNDKLDPIGAELTTQCTMRAARESLPSHRKWTHAN